MHPRSGPVSLNEFQQAFATRMRDAASVPASGSALGMRSGGSNWLLRLEDAGEIIALPEIVPVPLSKPWYLGLTNVRGNLISVIDLALLGEGRPTPRTADCRVVLVAERYRSHAALLVQRLLGLKDPTRMVRPETSPPHVGEAQTSPRVSWAAGLYLEQGAAADSEPWRELDVASLVEDEAFLQAGL